MFINVAGQGKNIQVNNSLDLVNKKLRPQSL